MQGNCVHKDALPAQPGTVTAPGLASLRMCLEFKGWLKQTLETGMKTRIPSQDLSTGMISVPEAPGLLFEPLAKEVHTGEGLAAASACAWQESSCRLLSSDPTMSCPAQL